jgi:DNA-binding NarL/FixJ family response regulator
VTPVATRLYRIVIADDHAVVRRGLRSLLDSQPSLQVCAEASTGTETLDCVRRFRPDLVVLDLTMPEMNGIAVTRAVREQCSSTDVLVLTMHFSEELAREAIRAGALAYVLKSDADAELLTAIDRVRRKQPFFTSALASTVTHSFIRRSPESPGACDDRSLPEMPLSDREIEVVRLLAAGKSNKETAGYLGLSVRTVESHRTRVMQKMGFRSFSELVRFAVRNNLVEL